MTMLTTKEMIIENMIDIRTIVHVDIDIHVTVGI